ncbi:Flagellar basal body-associated protein FliL [Clostridium cavendishii DSM 21758]|uniref:Flagellar protein FliL n=1 Tax=Clostridium cavendishii DSM 21758 TaxID=1121302 RepID=A0A1M6AU30_9CLOT|nr:flagellar basal body-associated FliL family protein [Clostridium cavendishii]SHI39970.1 Flagellar basal body-associated protein FliL [Clostridium cavendishii DSM 21758]
MAEETKKEEKKAKGGAGKFIIIIFVVAVIVAGGTFAGVYMYMKGQTNTVVKEAYYDLKDEFLVNLSDEGGKSYVKAKVSVAYNEKDKSFGAGLDAQKAVLRDSIITFFKTKSSKELTDPKSSEAIKKELTSAINKKLSDGQLTNVLFQDLTVQK